MEKKIGPGDPRVCWRTLVLTLALAAAIAALAEITARSSFVRKALPAPSIGSGHRRLDIKLELLDRFVRQEGRLDCLFLGASDVNLGISPEAFNRTYESQSGRTIASFNFGLDGFVPPAAAVMAGILVKKYRPHWLIWGISPASFSDNLQKNTAQIVRRNPWCRYWTGSFNLEGWLCEHSAAYRYFLRFRIWLERPEYSRSLSQREAQTLMSGVPARNNAGVTDAVGEKFEREARRRRILQRFTIKPESLAALDVIVGLRSQTQVVLLEVPVHPRFYGFYGNGAVDHQKALRIIRERAERGGAFFLSPPRGLVPEEGFANSNHMNGMGAGVFSRWLAVQVKQAVDAGKLKEPVSAKSRGI